VSFLKLISCNPFVSLCKNSLIVDWRDQSLPQIRSSWTELSQQYLVCVSLLSLSFACGFVLFTLIPRLDLGAVIVVITCVHFDCGYYFPLLHPSYFVLVWVLSPNSQQIGSLAMTKSSSCCKYNYYIEYIWRDTAEQQMTISIAELYCIWVQLLFLFTLFGLSSFKKGRIQHVLISIWIIPLSIQHVFILFFWKEEFMVVDNSLNFVLRKFLDFLEFMRFAIFPLVLPFLITIIYKPV